MSSSEPTWEAVTSLLMATSSAVTTQLIGEVLVIRVDDGKANALTPDVIQSVSDALTEGFEQAKAVTIIGREGKFSAGFDLKIMTSGVEQARDLLGAGAALGLKIFEAPVPVVLGVTGHALAMGGILTTCADYRVGADGPFKLGLNEVAIGMPVPISVSSSAGTDSRNGGSTSAYRQRRSSHLTKLLRPTTSMKSFR